CASQRVEEGRLGYVGHPSDSDCQSYGRQVYRRRSRRSGRRGVRSLTMSGTPGTVAHMDFSHVLMLIIGLLFGAIVAWALTRSRLTAALGSARTQAQSERARAEEIAADYRSEERRVGKARTHR